MLEVISYIKNGEEFTRIEDFEGLIDDPDYIEGAIEIITQDNILLSLNDWDYVDQMWCYLVDGLNAVKAWQEFSTCFPDHPTEITFIPNKESRTVEFGVRAYEYVYSRLDYDEFMVVMIDAALNFFKNLNRICEDLKEFNLDIIQNLISLKSEN